ncbi:hypothetical protein Tco_0459083 [Tanacetum coccineum]
MDQNVLTFNTAIQFAIPPIQSEKLTYNKKHGSNFKGFLKEESKSLLTERSFFVSDMAEKEDIEKIGNRSETAKVNNEGLYGIQPSGLVYMFKDTKGQDFNEDRLRVMHNKYLEEYIETLDNSAEMIYYKTARVPNQDQRSNLDIPARTLEVGKRYTCPTSHQCDFGESSAPNLEVASTKGKEKIEHFGVKLEEEDHDRRQFHPTQLNKRPTLNNGIKIKEEETSSTSSEDLVIV